MFEIASQRPADGPSIETLLDLCFGPDRHRRPSYRLRDGVAPLVALGLVARSNARLVGSLRFWPILIGGATPALLLGPLAVDPDHRGQKIATALVARGLDTARRHGHRIVATIGEPAFFSRFGFVAARTASLAMPGAVDDTRFLVAEIAAGALAGATGVLGPAGPGLAPDQVAPRPTASYSTP
ncbi:MAG: GNAT family N-acetyltransferase [Alphaproteobacteria bacterium]